MWPPSPALARKLADDPVLFSRECLDFEPWDKQAEIMRAVAAHNYVAVRSGQKVGKSRVDAALAIWWGTTRPGALVLLTAPTYSQVEDPLWKEIRFLASTAKVKLSDTMPAIDPGTGWRIGSNSMIKGRSTDKSTRIQGLSGARIFFIVDEAAGYAEPLFEALKGNMAGGGKMLLTSNPNEVSGTFYDAFHEKTDLWKTFHIRSIDTPNFHGGDIPGLASPEWLDRQIRDWGEGSEAYQIRALGEFPSAASDAIIPLRLVEAAQARWNAAAFDADPARLELGVDVARGGADSTIIFPRRGYSTAPPIAIQGTATDDGPKAAGQVMAHVATMRRPGEKPRVKVDTIGYGASCFDSLKQHSNSEIELVGVNSAERSDDVERYHNLRAQLHFAVRDWLKEGGTLPPDGQLAGELVAAKWKPDVRGRSQVEPKDEIKKRLGRSPDRADGLSLAVYSRGVGYDGQLPGVFHTPSFTGRW